MATLKDVAEMTGVSATTVSIIVNGKAEQRQISPQTVEKVNEAIRLLNYQPSISARSLRSTEPATFTVGVFWVTDFRSSFLSRFITGLQDQKINSDFKTNIVICPYKWNELHKEENLYKANAFNAVIIAAASEQDMNYIHEHPLPFPTVINNRISDQYHTVCIDNIELGAKAARHLIERGVQTVGVVSLNDAFFSMNSSTKGFMQECRNARLKLMPEHLISTGLTMQEGYQAGEALLASGQLPDAIFCDNDSMAMGVTRALNKHQVKIPEEVQIIAISQGHSVYTEFYTPSITIVDVPLEIMGAKCLEVVEAIANHKVDGVIHYEFDSVLRKRESTRDI